MPLSLIWLINYVIAVITVAKSEGNFSSQIKIRFFTFFNVKSWIDIFFTFQCPNGKNSDCNKLKSSYPIKLYRKLINGATPQRKDIKLNKHLVYC